MDLFVSLGEPQDGAATQNEIPTSNGGRLSIRS